MTLSIQLTDAGKRFNRDWIFRHFNYTFNQGHTYAITGPNGSGKSTLLQAIAGSITLNEGTVSYSGIMRAENEQREIIHPVPETRNSDGESHYRDLAIAAPYLELVEEMTASELMKFHSAFKTLLPGMSVDRILTEVGLFEAAGKQVRYFSSGMKQRLKLAQAVFSDVPVLLLDEPCTNLDVSGYALYHKLVLKYCSHKMIIVSSNDEREMDFCRDRILITDYKHA